MRKVAAIAIAFALLLAFTIPIGIADDTTEINMSIIGSADIIVVNETGGTYWGINGSYNQIEGTLGTVMNSSKHIITNNGTVNVAVTINATDATNWTLENTAGHNQFVVKHNQTGSWTTIPEATATIFMTDLAWNGTNEFWFQLELPTTSESPEIQLTTVTFEATVNQEVKRIW